jgi:translation initiation factor 2A
LISPVAQKSFFKGDKVQMKWNPRGSSVLVLAQTEVDRTNKSYYGETTLYLLDTDGTMDARITLDKEGPIHDFTWSPNSREFAVIYGYMPAKTTIYDDSAVAIHSFPIGPRNTILFSPTGRFALIAGFGNLAGQIDVYDMEKNFCKVSTIESGNPSVCQWGPDDRYIVTATTSPRLRVDNGINIWYVSGQLVYHEDMVELYDVAWRPSELRENTRHMGDPLATVPFQHQSAIAHLGVTNLPAKQAGVYRPPGARGLATPLHFKREDEGGAAHTVGKTMLSSSPAGFGSRARRVVPGAEPIDGSQIMRRVPGSEPVREEPVGHHSSSKTKKKKNKRKSPQDTSIVKDQDVPDSDKGTNDIEAPMVLLGDSIPSDDQAVALARGQHVISELGGPDNSGVQENGRTTESLSNEAVPPILDTPQNPLAKKIRSLHKKVRAIQDLELRLASGAKLEDTQIKKISTKESVQQELDTLERVFALDSNPTSKS